MATEEKKTDDMETRLAGVLVGADGSVVDPTDEDALDRLLAESSSDPHEPGLIIVDRLLTRLRYRREV